MQATYANINGHSSKLDEQYKLVASLIGKVEGNMEKQNAEFYKSLSADADLATYLYNNHLSVLSAPQYVLLNEEMYNYLYFEGVIST